MKVKFDKFKESLSEHVSQSLFDELSNNIELNNFGNTNHYTLKKLGIEFVFDLNFELRNMIFFNENEDHERFNGRLPMNLDFSMSRKEVQDQIGKPFKEVNGIPALEVPKSDYFRLNNCILSVFYSDGVDKIEYLQVGVV